MVSQACEPMSLVEDGREGVKCGIGSTNVENRVTASDKKSFG